MLFPFLHNLETLFSSSPLAGLAVSFLAGILMSFSPCILPLVPITLSVVGVTSLSSRLKGFIVSLVFVLGVAVTYTILGVIAAVFRIFIDKFFTNPVTYVLLSLFFILMALSVFGVIKINFFTPTYNHSNKANLFSVFMLGLVSGLGVIPCNFPILGSILTLISLRKDVYYGALALFLFALGYGLILILLGTFGSLIVKLPKKGLWIAIVNKSLGILMLLMGAYFFFKFIYILKI